MMDMSEYLKHPLELDSICRTCLTKKDGMKTIFEACLEEMVTSFTDMKIKQGDGLPDLICRQCILAISRAYSFKKMCEKNSRILTLYVAKEFQDELEAYRKKEAAIPNIEHLCSENQECVSVIHMASTTNMNNITIKCDAINNSRVIQRTPENPVVEYDNSTVLVEQCDDVILMEPSIHEGTSVYSNPKYNCTKCKQSFELQVDYKLHMLLHPLDKICQTCGKTFTGTHAYKRHLKTHLLIKPHACDLCDKSFAESSNLQKHKKKHTGELRNVVGKPHLCSVCGRGFKWATSLSKHSKYHTGKKLLTCQYCSRQYVEPRSLEVHMRGHTGERPFKCDICDRSFTQQCNLQKHQNTHTGERPYVCDICGKGFSQKGYIQIHMRIHTGEKPYVCSYCGKGFSGSNALLIHKRIHTGEKPFQCGICEKQFTRQESLALHQRCHSGERPFKCTLCQKGFNNTSHLQSHMRSHTGEKPYPCSICEKRFATSGSLKVHLRMHTGERPYLCGVCGKSFSQSSTLASHMNMHLEKEPSQSANNAVIQHNPETHAVIQHNPETHAVIQHNPETQEVQILVQPQELVKAINQDQPHILVNPTKPHNISILDKGHITLVNDRDKTLSFGEEKSQHIMIVDNEDPASKITWCIMKNVTN